MKKLFILLFTIGILPFLGIAQNVGVDVATPLQKLDVAGAIKLGSTTTGVAGSMRWTGSNFEVHDGAQWITFGTGTDNDWAVVGIDMYSEPSGNVGIGTTSPAAKLQVVGTARVGALNVGGNYTLPAIDGGAGFVLTTNGSGVVSWINPALTGDITSVVAGDGLINGGTSGDVTLDVNPGDGIVIASDEVRVLASDLDGSGITVTSNNFDVNVDNSTLDINSDVLRVKPEGVTSNEIATGAVTTTEILNGTIVTADIATGGVTSTDILDATIVTTDIASAGNDQILTTDGSGNPQWVDQNVVFNGQAGDGLVLDGINSELDVNVDNSTIEINADVLRVKASGINSSHIQDGSIVAADIATGGVTTSDILNGTIVSADIATGGVNSSDILNETIVPADIADAGADQLLTTDGAGNAQWTNQTTLFGGQAGDGLVNDVPNSELDVNPGDGIAVTGDQVVVVASDLEGDGLSVTTNNFNVNVDNCTIEINADALRVKADGIQSGHIAPDVIVAEDIATGAVTTTEILDATILAADVAAGSNNTVLSTNASGVVGWNNPATLTTVLQDGDADTKITVDVTNADEDHIRLSTLGAERMTIDNAGEIGIGTNSPDRTLHVTAPRWCFNGDT